MRAVYRSGLVFMGDIDIPILDVRPYLETVLDMHNSHQSFASRKRMLNADGDASNQSIWFINGPGNVDITPYALDVMDQWMSNIAANPPRRGRDKPAEAVDRCFETDARRSPRARASGRASSTGRPGCLHAALPALLDDPAGRGRALRAEPIQVPADAGRDCHRARLYGVWTPSPAETVVLQTIFPQGVCDYTKPDAGLPPEW